MPDGGIYLSDDSYKRFQGDQFSQDARGVVADAFGAQAQALLPQMIDQAQQAESLRQAAEAHARDMAERDANVATFQSMAAPTLARLSTGAENVAPDGSAGAGAVQGVVPITPPSVDNTSPPDPLSASTAPVDATMGTPASLTPPMPAVSAPPEPATVPPELSPAPPVPPPVIAQPATPVSTAGLSGGGDLAGRIGQTGQAILSSASDAASWLGDQGQKALHAILVTEGGLSGARGDNGMSAGPLQFYEGGQLANFARQYGMTPEQAKSYVEQNPQAAVQWAIGTPDQPGYLGAAILAGQRQGLSGADLATYAQQHGQVSVSPERAGQNWNALFGSGAAGIASGATTISQTAGDILGRVKDFIGTPYTWGGKSPQTGFDCSGLAGYLTTGQPESTTSLYGKSTPVSAADARPGDLVFYNMNQPDMHLQHVAVSLGGGQIVQAGGTQAAVNVGDANQAVGSAPEYRRIGPGGTPVQAQLPDAPAGQTAAAAPAQPLSPMDHLRNIGDTISSAITSGLQGIFGGAGQAASNLGANVSAGLGQMQAGQESQTAGTVQAAQGLNQFRAENFPSPLDPNHPSNVLADLQAKYPSRTPGVLDTAAMTPEDRQRYDSLTLAVGGVEMGGAGRIDVTNQLGRATQPLSPAEIALRKSIRAPGADNEFVLHTAPPTPDAVPMAMPEVVDHMGLLEQTYAANDARIELIQNQLDGIRTGAKIDRPPWAAGMSDQGVLAVAKHFDLNPYQEGWANSLGAGEMQDVLSYYRGVGTKAQGGGGLAALRQELDQLKGQQQRILDASGQIVEGGNDATFYRPPSSYADLPWTEPDAGGQAAPNGGQYPPNAPASPAARTEAPAATNAPLSLTPASIPPPDYYPGTLEPRTPVGDVWNTPEAMAPLSLTPRTTASPYPGPTAPPPQPAPGAPLPTTDALEGLLQMAKSRGVDTSTLEPQLRAMAPVKGPPEAPPPAVPPRPPPDSFPAEVGAVPPSTPTGGAQPWDYLRALRVGSMAGGLPTMSHILLNAPLQTAFKLVSDLPLSVMHPETMPLEFVGAWQGLRGWAGKAASAPLGQPGKIAQSIGGTTGNVVETGLLGLVKTHPVLQDMARQIGSGMELWRMAGTEAANNGLQRFSGPWWTSVQESVANPSADMAAAAERAGNTFSLGGPMGQTGEAFANLRKGAKVVDFFMPFFNIGYHVATQGVERSPIGLIGTAMDAAQMGLGRGPYAGGGTAAGVTPLAERLRNNIVGTGLAVEAFHQAAQGNITGNGPDDPKLKADLLATGWQPDSLRIGGRYFPLHVLGPAGWPLSEAANLYEATHTGDQAGYAKPSSDLRGQFLNYLGRMAQYGESETFLRSIGQVLQAAGNAKDFGRLGEQEAASVLGSLIPQGALLANAASAMDPYNRKPETGNIGQAIQNRLPIVRQDLPLRLTPTGQPEPNAQQGLGILLPRSSLANPDPVMTALGQAGVGAPLVPKTIPVTSKYQMDLTPQEQQQWQQLHGQALNEQMKDAVADPRWKTYPVETQRAFIQKAMTKASDVARKQLLDNIPNAEIEKRVVLKTAAQSGTRVTVLGGTP